MPGGTLVILRYAEPSDDLKAAALVTLVGLVMAVSVLATLHVQLLEPDAPILVTLGAIPVALVMAMVGGLAYGALVLYVFIGPSRRSAPADDPARREPEQEE